MKYPCLVREFIHDRLYNSSKGYFMKETHQLGQISSPLRYHDISGLNSYLEVLGSSYPEFAFLTPVEIFQPWYGHTIGNYCLEVAKSQPLKFIEIGSGTGTGALSILDFYKNHHLKTYTSLQYYLCEISPVLAQISQKRLKEAHPELVKKGQVQVVNSGVMDWCQSLKQEVFIVGLEVLDNMPHDKVYKEDSEWKYQTLVTEDLQEEKQPITDPLIQECLGIYQKMPPKTDIEKEAEYQEGIIYNLMKFFKSTKRSNVMYLPTGTLMFMKHLQNWIEKPHYILADFDYLPNTLPGKYAPIVSQKGKESHEKKDYSTYLVNTGEADIFFPTDFKLLQQIHRHTTGRPAMAMKAHKFMSKYAKKDWTQTKTGYRPLFDDFRNTSFLTTE